MRFTITREALIRPLQRVVGAVEKRHSQPILANILTVVKNQRLLLTGTDLEIEMVARAPLESRAESGMATIPGKKWLDICRALPEQAEITVSLNENKVLVQSGKSRYALTSLPAENFPRVEEGVGDVELSVSQSALKQLLDFTSFAMAHQDVRYYLNGVYLIFSGIDLRVVATDGHRLATMALPLLRTQVPQPISVILPRKAVQEMQRLFAEEAEEIGLVIGSNHLRVVNTQTSFITKLVEGRFPDYRRVFPRAGEGNIWEVSRESLKQALVRVSALLSDRYRGIHLQLATGVLKIVATTPENDQVEDEVEVQYTGPAMEIGMNAGYLLEYLNIVTSSHVRATVKDPDSVVLFETAGERAIVQGQQVYVVMPMRL